MTWWIPNSPNRIFSFEIVKVCKNLQNLSVVEIIGKGGHSSCLLTFIENDSMKLGKNDLCQINHSVLCYKRYKRRYVILFFFFGVMNLQNCRSTVWRLEIMLYFLDLQLIVSGDLSRGSDDARNLRLFLYHHRLHFVQPSSNFILLEGEFVSFISFYISLVLFSWQHQFVSWSC